MQRIPDRSQCRDLHFHEMQLIQRKLMRHSAYLGTIQFDFEQIINGVQAESEGLGSLDEPYPQHFCMAVLPVAWSRLPGFGQQARPLINLTVSTPMCQGYSPSL